MGRLIIMAAAGTNAGKAAIKVTFPSLESAEIEIDCKEAYVKAGISANTSITMWIQMRMRSRYVKLR